MFCSSNKKIYKYQMTHNVFSFFDLRCVIHSSSELDDGSRLGNRVCCFIKMETTYLHDANMFLYTCSTGVSRSLKIAAECTTTPLFFRNGHTSKRATTAKEVLCICDNLFATCQASPWEVNYFHLHNNRAALH